MFNGVLFFGSSLAKAMVDLKTFQLITVFVFSVYFGYSGIVVYECKKVVFSTKGY